VKETYYMNPLDYIHIVPYFTIGPLAIHWYGILIVVGALLAGLVAASEARQRDMNPDQVWEALTLCLILGIIGARLYHVLTVPPSSNLSTYYYFTHPLDLVASWKGGLGIYGAIAGGALALYIYARRHKQSFLTWLDLAAMGVPLAQAIGRWGNFINQELYGGPTSLPWGILIHPENPALRVPPYNDPIRYPPETRFHPTFLYESLWNFLVFLLLLFLARRYRDRLLPGELFGIYLSLYSLGRFFNEFIRLDSPFLGGINIAQGVAVACIVSTVGLMLYRRRLLVPTRQHEP
jgi:phosphatidylglycerol:prolipoprotein diacylglycerol transferase